ncbi:hypothetical protein KY290_023373 [Solanum tuberosum]|uniref:Uncharacterized protein n=1 Tax=Solanum tuberosum TaxID=4113 RepID=A0ABQ7VA38_SOLTU|nr:hypothetical protein KY289_022420 [Solanum tuberosum]KAH0693241.1 hypothetical protein KY285_020338 [Solanum tuberosum]KAH0759880.1 hypothetical protein KY290_023373 [Solanum tuberosum]
MSNAEFRNAIEMLSQSVANKKNQRAPVSVNANFGSAAAKSWKKREKKLSFLGEGLARRACQRPPKGVLKFPLWRAAPSRAPARPFWTSRAGAPRLAERQGRQSQGKCSLVLLSSLSCGLAFQLAYSYIQCTDASWPAFYDDADTGTQGQHPARR